MNIVYYQKNYQSEWDDFVEHHSVNGTFLQTRRFLNYHPTDRFIDQSLMVYSNKGQLSAVIPGVKYTSAGMNIFVSHPGTTFGGIIVNKKNYISEKIIEIIKSVELFLEENNYQKVEFRQTPDVFSIIPLHNFDYIFQYLGYTEEKELSNYIDFSIYKEKIEDNFSATKRNLLRRCLSNNYEFKPIKDDAQVEIFYDLLCNNLKKHNAKPVHSLYELKVLTTEVIPNESKIYAVFHDSRMIAGCLLFLFNKSNVLHTQYLAEIQNEPELNAMVFLYYKCIEYAKQNNYRAISFGKVTENHGEQLNQGLLASKEAYGSIYYNNKTFSKVL